jgi:hypothetical protein
MSFLLSAKAGVREVVTVWEYEGFNNYGEEVFANPRHIQANWSDRDLLNTSASDTQEIDNSLIYTEADLIIGSYVMRGRVSSAKPPSDEARKVVRKSVHKFLSKRQVTYEYIV